MSILNNFLIKYHSFNIQVKAAFWFTMCSFLQKGISFVTIPMFTRLMTVEQYGTYNLYLSWLQIFTVITSLYLYYGVTNNALSKFEDDRSGLISSMQGLTVIITTVILLIYLIFWDKLCSVIGLAPIMIILLFVETYVTPALAFWSAKQRFEYRYKKLVAVTVLKSVLNPVLGLMAVYYATDKVLARTVSTVIVEVIVCGTIMLKQFLTGRVFFSVKYWKYALSLALPLLPHYLSGIILDHGDRIMISKLCGASEVALYSVAYSIGMLALIFITAINSSITPWIYSRLKVTDIESIKEKSRIVLLLIFCIAFGLMLASPEIVLIFGSTKYVNSVYAIPPVAASVFFIFLYNFLSFPEFYFEKTWFLMFASIIAAILNIILNLIFIPLYGFTAAAYTTLACYVIYSLGHFIVGGGILEQFTGYRSIIDNTFALFLSGTIILLGAFVNLIFNLWLLRYFIIGTCVVFISLKRELIIKRLIEKT